MSKRVPGERYRYIAFEVIGGPQFARGDLLHSLIVASRGTPVSESFRITVYENNFGILKVPHTLKEQAIHLLEGVTSVRGVPCRVAPLKTSGTIKTLKEKYERRIVGDQRLLRDDGLD